MLAETWDSQPLPAASPPETEQRGRCGGQAVPRRAACEWLRASAQPHRLGAAGLKAMRGASSRLRPSGLILAAPGQAATPGQAAAPVG